MIFRGENGGFSFWRYDMASDLNTWTLQLGFGGPREAYLDPLYRFQIRIEWRPLRTCFEWCVDHLGTERGWPVYQYRIIGFQRWPIAAQFHSDALNVYDEHKIVGWDRFWRCDHGRTGFGEGFVWEGCWRCAIWRPIKAAKAAWWKHVER